MHIYCNIRTFPVSHKLTKTISRIWSATIVESCAKTRKTEALKAGGNKIVYLSLLLRLAVLVNASRSDAMLPAIELSIRNAQQWQLSVSGDAKQWPLLVAELHDEQVQFKNWDIELNIQSEQFVD